MLELVLPTTRLHAALLDCRREWGPGEHEDALVAPARRVLDIDPGDPYAAGRRAR